MYNFFLPPLVNSRNFLSKLIKKKNLNHHSSSELRHLTRGCYSCALLCSLSLYLESPSGDSDNHAHRRRAEAFTRCLFCPRRWNWDSAVGEQCTPLAVHAARRSRPADAHVHGGWCKSLMSSCNLQKKKTTLIGNPKKGWTQADDISGGVWFEGNGKQTQRNRTFPSFIE